MRLGLVILLSLLMSGCALWRKDKDEPVETRGDREKSEPVLKPSEALRPETSGIASPVSDRFYIRGTYFQGNAETLLRVDSTNSTSPDGTELSAEDDLGLDDVIDQARMEFNIRMKDDHNVRIDYFKLNRFGEVVLDQNVAFGDFDFQPGDRFRSKIDYRTLSLTYTYSLVRTERFEWGIGLGAYVFEMHAEGGEPGTLNHDEDQEAGIFPTAASTLAFRISKRWAVTGRINMIKVAGIDDAEGSFQDWHADLQYRWRKNFAVGLGYTVNKLNLELRDVDEPFLYDMNLSGPELFFRASF